MRYNYKITGQVREMKKRIRFNVFICKNKKEKYRNQKNIKGGGMHENIKTDKTKKKNI